METTHFTITFEDKGPDNQGRRHFTAQWLQDEGPRSQCFFTIPEEFLRNAEQAGYTASISDASHACWVTKPACPECGRKWDYEMRYSNAAGEVYARTYTSKAVRDKYEALYGGADTLFFPIQP